jgi:hypothetical protein
MSKLWYSYDEVKDYHPIVEICLNNAVNKNNLGDFLEVEHHPTVPGISIKPDFGLKMKATGNYVFILEVKRKKSEVTSQRYGNQTRNYVTEFSSHWQNNYHKYFCLTNIEELILYADRPGNSLNSCILTNNPYSHGSFDYVTHDATLVSLNFEKTLTDIIKKVFTNVAPAWNNDWLEIINSFEINFKAIIKNLKTYKPDKAKDVTLYELLRFLIYAFLKEFYILKKNQNMTLFKTLPNNENKIQFEASINNMFRLVQTLDYKQIFRDHPDKSYRLFTENLNSTILGHFNNFITSLNKYINHAIKKNQSPKYFFSLLTSEILEKDEKHIGKIMSDTELSALLSTLCVEEGMRTILDPGCGDGALLDAAYDTLEYKSLMSGNPLTHNKLLSTLYGYDHDPFLTQLATFRLLSKNIIQVDPKTMANIEVWDIFDKPKPNFFDCILMNPPFLRNDDPKTPIPEIKKKEMIIAIKNQNLDCFVEKAAQPNLYFYFINYIWHYLKTGGKAGIILMAKFLNNTDAIYLREFLIDKVESVILYPRKYFSGFKVTTVIIVLKKSQSPKNNISFLRVINPELLADPENIKILLESNTDEQHPDFYLKNIPRADIKANENWNLFLLPKYKDFTSLGKLSLFLPIKDIFDKVSRGNAEAAGGTDTIFINSKSNPLSKLATKIEKQFIGYGLKNSKVSRKFILTPQCLEMEKALHMPSKFSKSKNNGLEPSVAQQFPGLDNYYSAANIEYPKWAKIVNSAFNHKKNPDILIPRETRQNYEIYYNQDKLAAVITTNFCFVKGLKKYNPKVKIDKQLKFMAGYFLSCFGHIQYELHGNNQDGARKLELKNSFYNFRVINPELIGEKQMDKVLKEFDYLNNIQGLKIIGEEGTNTPRRDLDLALGEIIFNNNNLGFKSNEEFVNFFERYLVTLVESREKGK